MTVQFRFAPKSICVVLGTRPEIVKLGHIIRLLGDAARVVHTGQHYDPGLSETFFREMELPAPDCSSRSVAPPGATRSERASRLSMITSRRILP